MTPEVIADFSKKEISISGKCYPDNSREFFHPLMNWVNEFLSLGNELESIEFDLEYFNTSSSLILLEIMKKLSTKSQRSKMIWLYDEEDDDMAEAASEYNMLIGDKLMISEKCSVIA